MFYKISSSVGSGKTQAVLEHIRDNLGVGYLFVCPTIALCEEVYRRALGVLAEKHEYVNNGPIYLVVSDEFQRAGAYDRALEACRRIDDPVPPIVIVTTKTFEFLVSRLEPVHKARFSVFVDEGLPAIKQEQFSPGELDNFVRYFDQDEAGFVQPAQG